MENIQIRRNIMRDAHLVICAAIFADGTKPPVSVVDYVAESGDYYQKITTSRHIFLRVKHLNHSMQNKLLIVDGERYVYKDVFAWSEKVNMSTFVISQSDSNMKFTIDNGTKLHHRIEDMFMEVFHDSVS